MPTVHSADAGGGPPNPRPSSSNDDDRFDPGAAVSGNDNASNGIDPRVR